MTMTFGTSVMLAWPFVIAGVAWGIAIWALSQPNEQSLLVKRLTQSSERQSRMSHPPYTGRSHNPHTNTDMETNKQ